MEHFSSPCSISSADLGEGSQGFILNGENGNHTAKHEHVAASTRVLRDAKSPKGQQRGGVMQSWGCLVWGPKEQSWELGTSHPELLSAPSQCVRTRVSGSRRKEWRKHPSKIIIIKPKNREGEIGRMELDQFERRFVGSVKLSG